MNKILTILAALAELLTRFYRAKEQSEHDQQQQQIKEDPTGWLDNHFNSDDNGVQPNKPMPNNAKQAKQTNTAKHTKKQ